MVQAMPHSPLRLPSQLSGKGSVAVLAAKTSKGVAPEVNLGNFDYLANDITKTLFNKKAF